MSQVLVISGHPELDSSYTNKVILNQLSDNISDIEVRRLDTLYPDYKIDIEAEQQAMIKADVIVLQFPFYWYSMPALLKKWMDDVFSFNFAYGPEGDKLKGKDFILSLTVGGPEESYDPLGYNHFTIEEMLRPMQQTAYLAGMNYIKPIYTHRMVYIPGVYNKLEEVEARARDHATRVEAQIEDLIYSPENRIQKFVANWFAKFDRLEESTEQFTRYLAEDVKWTVPEGEFIGHEGFIDWYAMVRKVFKPDCDHVVEQVEVKESELGYVAELRIRLIAETFDDSPMKGDDINLLVNETWQVSFDSDRDVRIHSYEVIPVNS
ncbi:NAD(P)H-dependent oxidoreductase [Vibrio sp. SCSIO 43140]|uniref:NAD(P)H-dependent oxidoreductase n=1 Tax=Vibrio sp. SCSIO 43140 TaxID=2819100 RepID=UPI002076319D|nr:NAD(P)H-dependent oxidoreductase [Vibrio sp. SCSIO 43140]USD59620.1 NAD(P)H-dependent oxidoreductase [Vibrio sp. SCSIO 43140]